MKQVAPDARLLKAAEELHLPLSTVQVRYGLIGQGEEECVYAWQEVLGVTILVLPDLRFLTFPPGTLLPDAQAQFRRFLDGETDRSITNKEVGDDND